MMTYGYSVKEHDDPFVGVVEEAVQGFSETLEPGAYLVDVIPLRESQFFRPRDAVDPHYNSFSLSNPRFLSPCFVRLLCF